MAPPSLSTMSMSITPKVPSDSFVSAAAAALRPRKEFQEELASSLSLGTDHASTDTGSGAPPGAQPGGQAQQRDGTMHRNVLSDAEILRRRKDGEALIVVKENVYNVTDFLEFHPGGAEVILEHLESEVVNDAEPLMRGKVDDDAHNHSKAAFRIMEQFLVGSRMAASGAAQSEAQDAKKYCFTVDLTKPIVRQVGYLGSDYDEWVHDSIITKESPRFFESDYLEIFTKTKWWVIPLVWIPVGMIMLYLAAAIEKVPLPKLVAFCLVGVVIWTLEEYILHRFLFHIKTSSYWGNTFHYVIHGFHHKHPMDVSRLVFPPVFSLLFLIVLWFVVFGKVSYPIRLCILASSILSYVAYDLTHYFLHFGTAFNDETRKLKRYHLNHHFKDQTNGYGITTTVWDSLFRTRPASKLSLD